MPVSRGFSLQKQPRFVVTFASKIRPKLSRKAGLFLGHLFSTFWTMLAPKRVPESRPCSGIVRPKITGWCCQLPSGIPKGRPGTLQGLPEATVGGAKDAPGTLQGQKMQGNQRKYRRCFACVARVVHDWWQSSASMHAKRGGYVREVSSIFERCFDAF